jgi:Skp family chaperone for outer membrane proteins
MTMHFRRTLAVAVAIAGVAGFSAWQMASAQNTPPAPANTGPLKVGIVDLGKLGDGLTEAGEINRQLMAQRDDSQKQLDEIVKRLKSVTDSMGLIADHNSPEFLKLWGEAAELEVSAKARKQALERVFDQQKGMVTANMYARMVEGIGLWAAQEGYDLVMVDDRATMPWADQGSEVAGQMIQSRQVLFASARMDVTQQVMTFMNNRYAAKIPSKASAPMRNAAAPAPAGPTGAPGATGSMPAPIAPTGPTGRTAPGH